MEAAAPPLAPSSYSWVLNKLVPPSVDGGSLWSRLPLEEVGARALGGGGQRMGLARNHCSTAGRHLSGL